MELELEEIPWRACDLGEQPYDWETPFCVEPCSGCAVLAQGLLAQAVDAGERAQWAEILEMVAPVPPGGVSS